MAFINCECFVSGKIIEKRKFTDQKESTNFPRHKQAIRGKRKGRYLSYSDFSVSDGRRRATDRRRRDLAAGALLPRLLCDGRQEGVAAASRHLTRHARHINRIADMRVDWERLIIIYVFFLDHSGTMHLTKTHILSLKQA